MHCWSLEDVGFRVQLKSTPWLSCLLFGDADPLLWPHLEGMIYFSVVSKCLGYKSYRLYTSPKVLNKIWTNIKWDINNFSMLYSGKMLLVALFLSQKYMHYNFPLVLLKMLKTLEWWNDFHMGGSQLMSNLIQIATSLFSVWTCLNCFYDCFLSLFYSGGVRSFFFWVSVVDAFGF